MNCVMCKKGEMIAGVFNVTLERHTTTVEFKNVPAAVCDNCGEAYLSEETTAQLLETAEAAFGSDLSSLDKMQLVKQIFAVLKMDWTPNPKKPKRSLYGIWSDVDVSEEDIAETRQEMWGNFPREDI